MFNSRLSFLVILLNELVYHFYYTQWVVIHPRQTVAPEL